MAWLQPNNQRNEHAKLPMMSMAAMTPKIDQIAALSQGGTRRSAKDERGEDEAEGA
jgi:hypothetical protein